MSKIIVNIFVQFLLMVIAIILHGKCDSVFLGGSAEGMIVNGMQLLGLMIIINGD